VAALAKRDRDRVEARRQRLASLAANRTTLDERRDALGALEISAARARQAAEQAVRDRNALIRQIDQQRDLTAQLAGELQVAQDRLQASIRSAATPAPALPLGPFRGDLDWPASGTVSRRFGQTPPGQAPMNGIQIAAVEAADVRAIHDGTVAFADTFAGFGRLVILDHGGGNFSLYGYLLDSTVVPGQRVAASEVVGAVGVDPTGGPSLYFEIRIDGRPVDPLQWLKSR
jgi:septal ring factor EnvC (AmiA/AmiB activator)